MPKISQTLKPWEKNKSILFIPLLLLMSCDNGQIALFPGAYSAVFESFTELEIRDPSVSRTLAMGLDKEVIRQDLNTLLRETLGRMGFDIEYTIGIWEKYKGKDLSSFVEEDYLHYLVPEDSILDVVTRVSLSAPVFSNDTSFFVIYMLYETNESDYQNKSHQYLMYGKEKGSWIWMMATSYFPDH